MIMSNKVEGYHRVLFIIIPYFIIVGIFQFIGIIFSGVEYGKLESLTPEQLLIISFSSFIGTFILLMMFMKNVDNEKFINLGFEIKNRLKDFFLGIGIGVLLICSCFLLITMFTEITFQYNMLIFIDITISVLSFLIISIAEEMFFRGYVLRNLLLSLNKNIALTISAISFTLLHVLNPNIDLVSLFNIFLAGILLGISYVYTKNLWFPIGLHFSWNLSQSLLGFNVSGQEAYSIIEVNILEKNILNGGEFGLEGSIFSVVLQVICITLLFFYFKNKKI